MALPPNNPTSELTALRQTIEKLSPEELSKLPYPLKSDYHLMGSFIQLSNYIELNLRRSADVFVRAGKIAPKQRSVVPVGQILKDVQIAVSGLDPSIDDILRAEKQLNEIALRLPLRNMLAHFAVRKALGHRAMVLLTRDERDAAQFQISYGTDGIGFALMMVSDLREVASILSNVDKWLAAKTHEWAIRYATAAGIYLAASNVFASSSRAALSQLQLELYKRSDWRQVLVWHQGGTEWREAGLR
jgi:hypothetical protein